MTTAVKLNHSCPFEGCQCSYKGLKTLYNHYTRVHRDANWTVAIELFNAWARKKKTVTKSNAVLSNTPDYDAMTFDELKQHILPRDTPTSPEPHDLPLPSWVIASAMIDCTIEDVKVEDETDAMIDGMIEDVIYEIETDEMIDGMIEDVIFEVETDADAMIDGMIERDEDVKIENETDAPEYDRELIECCLKMYDGGFVKAYRLLKRRDNSFTVNLDAHIQDIKEHLELVYNSMCDAWYDFKTSDDFGDDDYDFDDDTDWLDVCYKVVFKENLYEFS
jgi:hypothetical protein